MVASVTWLSSTPDDAVRAGQVVTHLPRHRLTFSFSRASGAGGQNVNKLNTKAEVRIVNLGAATWLDDHIKTRLRSLFPAACTKDGDVVVTSQRHRTQEGNVQDAVDKLTAMVAQAAVVPVARAMRQDVTADVKAGWREEKRRRGDVKARRRGGGDWDE